jgi:1-acyl-sn-glycerol-3-phosphate acyltransferase
MGSRLLSLANAAETLGICVPTVVDSVLHRSDERACDRRLARWAPRVLERARVRLTVVGREHVRDGQAYVVMSNHASFYDIPVLYAAFGGNLRMVAKTELYRIPIFGRAMREAGFIEVDRKNRSQALKSLSIASGLLAKGTSLWIAPEGTRSGAPEPGGLGPFKKGGFRLALDGRLPILPVSLAGTWKILPPHTTATERGVDVRVTFQAPLDTGAYVDHEGRPDLERLMNDVRESIAKGL